MSKEQLYGAAFGFTTERRIKPIHFASGLFLSIIGRHYSLQTLNKTVALKANKEMEDDYATPTLSRLLLGDKRLAPSIDATVLHEMRRHLHSVAANDEAVYPVFSPYSGFGCDYSLVSSRLIANYKRNDGYAGYFVYQILNETKEGKDVLRFAKSWLNAELPMLERLFQPLLDATDEAHDWDNQYDDRFGGLTAKRRGRLARIMAPQTHAICCLCRNLNELVAPESCLRGLIIGLLIWLFQYLLREGNKSKAPLLFVDFSGHPHSRLRTQSRWCFVRNLEQLRESFTRFEEEGRFTECEDDFETLRKKATFPLVNELYREIALRSGLAQPRANAVQKHFELQPDTLRVLILSLIPHGRVIDMSGLAKHMTDIWGIRFGGNADDAERLAQAGYAGLDQQEDLSVNTEAMVRLLVALGLAIAPADGLVLCSTHSEALA